MPQSPPADVDELRQLVAQAFEKARDGGKEEWRRMTPAVLKNRLLQISAREFRLERYGLETTAQIASMLPTMLTFHPGPPSYFELADDSSLAPPSPGATVTRGAKERTSGQSLNWRTVRIRDDLWKAVLDQDSGSEYVLDPESGLARPRLLMDDSLPVLPTIDTETMQSWRQAFADERRAGLDAETIVEVDSWTAAGSGTTRKLPRTLRGDWTETLKRQVTQHLTDWFRVNQLATPSDLHVEAASRGEAESEVIEEVVQTRRLRSALVRALSLMSYEEMAALPIPARVAVRLYENH